MPEFSALQYEGPDQQGVILLTPDQNLRPASFTPVWFSGPILFQSPPVRSGSRHTAPSKCKGPGLSTLPPEEHPTASVHSWTACVCILEVV